MTLLENLKNFIFRPFLLVRGVLTDSTEIFNSSNLVSHENPSEKYQMDNTLPYIIKAI